MQFHFQIGNVIKWNMSQSILIAYTCCLESSVMQMGGEYSLTQEGNERDAHSCLS